MASFDLHKNERTSFGYDMNTETETDRELLEEEECCEDDRLPEPRLGVTCSCGHCHHGHGA